MISEMNPVQAPQQQQKSPKKQFFKKYEQQKTLNKFNRKFPWSYDVYL